MDVGNDQPPTQALESREPSLEDLVELRSVDRSARVAASTGLRSRGPTGRSLHAASIIAATNIVRCTGSSPGLTFASS